MEHKGNRDDPTEAWYIERPDFFNSIAFWYHTGVSKPFGSLPPWPERCVPWQNHHLVRAFRQATVLPEPSSGSETGTSVQVQTTGFFGMRPALFWPNADPGALLSLPFTIEEEGRYAVRLIALKAPSYGLFAVELDGERTLPAVEFAAPEEEEVDLLLGTYPLAAGSHTLAFRARSMPSATARPLAVEMLRLLKLPPEAVREVKTDNEAHFIRLGIGRAVYAYRLAYGELPESLETLVKSGILESRYRTDENGFALVSRREGDYLVVKSTAPEGWEHRWQGADARR